MNLIQTKIPDVVIIEPTVFEDERGWFFESFTEQRLHVGLQRLGLSIPAPFIQDNHSSSKKNVLRGLHYQRAPHAQGKLVRVVRGAVFDVAIDLRDHSPTLGQYVGIELSAENNRMLWIPEGFAHGFLALDDDTHFLYKITGQYNPAYEACIRWDDPTLSIQWPLSEKPILNEKDKLAVSFDERVC